MVDRLPESLRAEHDAVMGSQAVPYRGYIIKPVSHRHQPYFIGGRFIYWGWIIVYASGEYAGCNAGPGATWALTVGGAKTIIDCLHETGPAPPVAQEKTREKESARLDQCKAWSDRFWKLMEERREIPLDEELSQLRRGKSA